MENSNMMGISSITKLYQRGENLEENRQTVKLREVYAIFMQLRYS